MTALFAVFFALVCVTVVDKLVSWLNAYPEVFSGDCTPIAISSLHLGGAEGNYNLTEVFANSMRIGVCIFVIFAILVAPQSRSNDTARQVFRRVQGAQVRWGQYARSTVM